MKQTLKICEYLPTIDCDWYTLLEILRLKLSLAMFQSKKIHRLSRGKRYNEILQ